MDTTNKNKKIAVAIAAVIVIAGIAYYATNGNRGEMQDKSESASQEETMMGGSNPLFSSIKDAMQRGLALECTFTEDGQSATAYIKGEKVRMVINNPTDKNSPNNFLMLNNNMMMWATGSSQGFMVAIDEKTSQQVQQQTQGAGDVDKATNTDVLGSLEKFKQTCKPATVADSEFEKPAGVNFINFSDLYKNK